MGKKNETQKQEEQWEESLHLHKQVKFYISQHLTVIHGRNRHYEKKNQKTRNSLEKSVLICSNITQFML